MTEPMKHHPDPKRDLLLERSADVSPELVWKAWTTPELLMQWFTPKPWETVACTIDLRPGGEFHTVMRSPEGQEFPGSSCILEVVPNRKLVWTSALAPGYRPTQPAGEKECANIAFTAVITMEPYGSGCKYAALVIHPDEDSCMRHAAMGFQDGWGKCFDQLVELMQGK